METETLITLIRDADQQDHGEHLPSFFEIILVDNIDSMIKPAFHHGIEALHDSLPISWQNFASFLRSRWNDMYNIMILVAQWFFIRKWNATISESLYGLTRRGANYANLGLDSQGKSALSSSSPLQRWQQDVSIWFVVVLPQLIDTLKSVCKDIRSYARRHRLVQERQVAENVQRRDDHQNLRTGTSVNNRDEVHIWSAHFIRRCFWNSIASIAVASTTLVSMVGEATAEVFPYANAAVGLWVVSQKLLYLFGRTVYAHPFNALTGIALVKRNSRVHQEVATGSPTKTMTRSSLNQVTTIATRETDANNEINWRSIILAVAILSVKGVQWFMQHQDTHENAGQRARTAANVTTVHAAVEVAPNVPSPPPRPSMKEGRVRGTSADDFICPLCRLPHRSPAVSTGGVVFCYNCLLQSLKADIEHGINPLCPVTAIPCRITDIILIH
jgi:hypothetical protein